MSDRFPDPPVRLDGLCVVCLDPRRTEKLPPLYRDQVANDPFCSNVCARAYYGVPEPAKAPRPVTKGW